eukprot:c20991_g1_i1 orf=886-1131(+)
MVVAAPELLWSRFNKMLLVPSLADHFWIPLKLRTAESALETYYTTRDMDIINQTCKSLLLGEICYGGIDDRKEMVDCGFLG